MPKRSPAAPFTLACALALSVLTGCAPAATQAGRGAVPPLSRGSAAPAAPAQPARPGEPAAQPAKPAAAAVAALLAPAAGVAAPSAVAGVGTALALDTTVQALLADAEVLAGNGLIGLDASGLIGPDASGLLGDGGLRYALLSDQDDDDERQKAKDGWRGLSKEEREARKAVHRKREERVLEAARAALAKRRGAFKQVGTATEATAADGARITTTKLAVAGGEVTVTREVDEAGMPVRLAQRFVGQLEGVAVEATRTRTLRPDGSVLIEASAQLGTGAEARTVAWTKTVTAEGGVSGVGKLKGADGREVALTVSGDVTAEEQIGASVEGVEVAVVRAAGRDDAEVRVRDKDGKEKRGAFRASVEDRDDDKDDDKDDDHDDHHHGASPAPGGDKAGPAASGTVPVNRDDDDDKDDDDKDDDDRPATASPSPSPSQSPDASRDDDRDDDDRDDD
ncbi:MAG: hypothetical protein VKS61_01480 [Candidatus Sericytochromatia bacterium]|nr:hypothetical protein [Candidatus Sericytochromatia bacterium]